MVFATEYFGNIVIQSKNVLFTEFIEQCQKCIQGRVLYIYYRGADYFVGVLGTAEYIDFSETLNKLLLFLKDHECSLEGTIIAVQRLPSFPTVMKFEVSGDSEKVDSPVNVLQELSNLQKENDRLHKKLSACSRLPAGTST